MPTPDYFLSCLRADAARLAEVGRLGLAADVPCCPGWTVESVLRHTAVVYLHKVEAIRRNARPEPWEPDFSDRDAQELYDDATARLIAQLEESGPSAPSWTWWPPDQTTGFLVPPDGAGDRRAPGGRRARARRAHPDRRRAGAGRDRRGAPADAGRRVG